MQIYVGRKKKKLSRVFIRRVKIQTNEDDVIEPSLKSWSLDRETICPGEIGFYLLSFLFLTNDGSIEEFLSEENLIIVYKGGFIRVGEGKNTKIFYPRPSD